jgi:hypothetical protein
MLTDLDKKNAQDLICEFCDFKCSKKCDYARHCSTRKHKMFTTFTQKLVTSTHDDFKNEKRKYHCGCGKQFSYRQSLSVHKKKCNVLNGLENIDKGQPLTTELVMQLIQQNQKLQEMIFDLAKEGKSVTNNNTTNNNNNQFNLNFFLNEQCKDALNLMEFVESLNVQLKDLEYTAAKGYAEGISNIFINGLSKLSVHKRPLHCSDSKREVLYIKDNGEWLKDDVDKSKLTRAIKIVGNKNMQQIKEWQKAYPDYKDPSSKQNDKYMKMLCNAMSGSTQEEADKNYEKIIRNITREVVIDKSM